MKKITRKVIGVVAVAGLSLAFAGCTTMGGHHHGGDMDKHGNVHHGSWTTGGLTGLGHVARNTCPAVYTKGGAHNYSK